MVRRRESDGFEVSLVDGNVVLFAAGVFAVGVINDIHDGFEFLADGFVSDELRKILSR